VTLKRKRPRRRKKARGHYHRGVHVSPKAGECHYRSGWEFSFMKFLDADPSVTSYTYEGLVIEYVSNKKTGKKRKYFPDFQVKYADGRFEVIEVKPLRRTTQVKVVRKAQAACEWCRLNGATYVLMTEVELKALGVI
jgi:hypothetical protein